MARDPAKRVASRIFNWSISCSEAVPIPQSVAWAMIVGNKELRWLTERSLESSSTGREQYRGRMTTAATTGPANGPRPASSSPAIRRKPQAQADASKNSVGPLLVSSVGMHKIR